MGKVSTKRIVYLDLLKFLAAVAVVFIHTCAKSDAWLSQIASDSSWQAMCFYDNLAKFSVPVFMMISGSFILDKKCDSSFKKIFSRSVRIIVATVFWVAVSSFVTFLRNLDGFTLSRYIESIKQDVFYLWFVPAILFLYWISPLLKEICKKPKLELYFIALSILPLIYNTVSLFFMPSPIKKFISDFHWEFVVGYTCYFVLGHYITKNEIKKKHRILIYCAGALSLAVNTYLTYWLCSHHMESSKILKDLNIFIYIYSAAIFVFFKYAVSKIKFSDRAGKVITTLSSFSLGMYLSHMIVLRTMSQFAFEGISRYIYVPVFSLVVSVICIIMIFVISKIPVLKKYVI